MAQYWPATEPLLVEGILTDFIREHPLLKQQIDDSLPLLLQCWHRRLRRWDSIGTAVVRHHTLHGIVTKTIKCPVPSCRLPRGPLSLPRMPLIKVTPLNNPAGLGISRHPPPPYLDRLQQA